MVSIFGSLLLACEDTRVLRMRNALYDVVVKRDNILLENNHCSNTQEQSALETKHTAVLQKQLQTKKHSSTV